MVLGSDGRPVSRQVRPGVSDDLNTQIASGLESGEEVIVGQAGAGQGQTRTQGK